jgi:hypothetical protein
MKFSFNCNMEVKQNNVIKTYGRREVSSIFSLSLDMVFHASTHFILGRETFTPPYRMLGERETS